MNQPTPAAPARGRGGPGFAAGRRNRTTSRTVLIGDRVAHWTITVGGLLVILAVIGIMVFLVEVALPLLGSGAIQTQRSYTVAPAKKVAWLNADEYHTVAMRIATDGAVDAFHLDTGRIVRRATFDFGGAEATAVGGTVRRNQILFGFADGTLRFAEAGFDVAVVRKADVPPAAERLSGRDRAAEGRVYSEVPGEQFRRITLRTALSALERVSDQPIVAVDYQVGGTVERPTRSFVAADAAGVVKLGRTETQRNLLTGQVTTRVTTATLPSLPVGTKVVELVMTAQADQVYAATRDGTIFRFDTRDPDRPTIAETVTVLPPGVALTAMDFLVGDQALLVAGWNGAVDVLFRLQADGAGTNDGYQMVRARSHQSQPAAITAMTVSQGSKVFATQDTQGAIWLRQSTADKVMLQMTRSAKGGSPVHVLLAPRVDGVLALDDAGNADFWAFDYPHPETSLKTLFGKVWYEGYAAPSVTWQSSSGTDVFEPKLSLVPLIFGTVKAAAYSLLFAVPIALLGAIYTSEFVHFRVRAGIKPVMEMMGSLPTVVLGFVAALVLAPIVETWIAAVMLAFLALPLALFLGAFLWQMLPTETALRLEGMPKFLFMFVAIACGVGVAYRSGAMFERVLFAGDFKAWVNGDLGTGLPFLFLLLLPLGFLSAALLFDRMAGRRYLMHLRPLTRTHTGLVDLGKWLLLLAAGAAIAGAGALLLTALGIDPRGGVVGTYVQRNALVVGFVMGFAVIPIIYTLAEDALNAIPPELRAASLACGATPWQTAIWVVLPTAASGVFAAVMVGMGRAVGETMIVVMAAGNTPVLDWNVFNGLRTLSANIAVELPEAAKDSTLYRTLFLAALTLFAMTFVINTVAEIIRQRFRKRAFQL
ncbi:MAG: ABC transporter permease subunit [Alphaproteobacteria bacterium]|nr:ABC transporter permease subunit [Alphaproteobacteria bacterium]